MSKSNRKKFGVLGQPIPATRVLVKPLDPEHFGGGNPQAIIAINDEEGTFTSANVYGEKGDFRLGKGYDPESMTHPLPAEGDPKWKAWSKRGYSEGKVSDLDILESVKVKAKAKSSKEKAAANA